MRFKKIRRLLERAADFSRNTGQHATREFGMRIQSGPNRRAAKSHLAQHALGMPGPLEPQLDLAGIAAKLLS